MNTGLSYTNGDPIPNPFALFNGDITFVLFLFRQFLYYVINLESAFWIMWFVIWLAVYTV